MSLLIGTKEYLKHWEDIINAVDMEGFPIDLARSVSFNVEGHEKQTIDLVDLQDKGYSNSEIEEIIVETMHEYPERDGQLEFKFNIMRIAIKAQAMTDKILKNIPTR